MENNLHLTALLDEVLQPREDYFSIELVQPLLLSTIENLVIMGDNCWDKQALIGLAEAISSGQLALTSQPGQGEKGIHGANPIHGALFKLAKEQDKVESLDQRLLLLAHIINAASQWRSDMQAAKANQNFLEQRDKRLKQTTYLKNLEAACKVARRIETDWLDFLTTLDQSTDELREQCDEFEVDNDDGRQQDIYIKELGRFFAYALNKRQPRRGYQETTDNHQLKTPPTVQRKRRFDDDPDDRWEETSISVITPPPDIDEKTEDELRTSGLSTTEERPTTELTQSDRPIKAAKGDSSLQAVFRARSQQIFKDKTAQLLPGRWEQLSAFDLYQLMQQLSQHQNPKTAQHKQVECLIGLLLATGRSLESVLNAQVVTRLNGKQIPQAISEQSLYVIYGDSPCWVSGIYRPESSRKLTGEWPAHMRKTQDRMALPILPFCWQLMEPHMRYFASKVKERSVSLFSSDGWTKLESGLKALLSDTNRNKGSRLTVHRLSTHLFNVLNQGDTDLTAACLITARVPSLGQQASLYYYAPRIDNLKHRYTQAMQAIEQQCSPIPTPAEAEHSCAIASAETPSDTVKFVGSQLVPKTAYVKDLVIHTWHQIKEAKKCAFPEASFRIHNAYVAYTIAMLMFSTGYRSIRDPLPRWENISLSRGMIVIADKTDDQQSHARFMPLTNIMVKQLQQYLQYRQGIISRLQFFLKKDWGTPFMFLDDKGQPKAVTPSLLKDQLEWPDSPPLNINRHFLHTRLKESGLSSEIVDAFMGHWDAGQEPWANYSTFCPREYRNLLTPAIECLLIEQGWKALEGAAL